MKKSFSFMLSLALIFSMFSFSGSRAFAAENNVESTIQTKNIEGEFTFEDIMSLEKYVSVNNEGLFILDTTSAVKDGVSLALLEGQQKYFDSLNLEIEEGTLKANKSLEITNLESDYNTYSPNGGVSLLGNCNGVTKPAVEYWWGKSRKFDSCDANKFSADLYSVAAGAAGAGLLGFWIPGMGWASIGTTAYCSLYASRVSANNSRNTGIIVDMTWAMVYDIEPQ